MSENKEENVLYINGNVKYTKTITKKNGETFKIVARYAGLNQSNNANMFIDVYKIENEQWVLCKNDVIAKSEWVSRDHYIKEQRPEKLKVATIGYILKVSQEFKELLFTPQNLFLKITDSFHNQRFNKIEFKLINLENQ